MTLHPCFMDDLITDMVEMTRDGLLIAKCPNCHIPLSIEELESTMCECSDVEIDIQEVLFISSDELPKA